MIEEEEYRPRRKEEPSREKTEAERKEAFETLAYLESLPWQPVGIDW